VLRDRAGATAVEFAVIASVFIPLCLGSLDTGLLLWTKGILQSTAAATARCAAIASSACTDIAQFAVTTAGNWAFPGIIQKANLTPAPGSVCLSHQPFIRVTIASPYWNGAGLYSWFSSMPLTVTAYFPMTGTC
jgi:Flp pilus assembly pilin Flp